MNPNILLMALAGLANDTNASMDAAKAYSMGRELDMRQQAMNQQQQARSQTANVASGMVDFARDMPLYQDRLKQLQGKQQAVSSMPDNVPDMTVPFGNTDYQMPNQEKTDATGKLVSEIQQFSKANIHPADALGAIIKSNPMAEPTVVAKYIGDIYSMSAADKKAWNDLQQIMIQHQLNKDRDLSKIQAENAYKDNSPNAIKEFEAFYKNKGGDVGSIKGTPEYEKQYQDFLKTKQTPAQEVKLQFTAPIEQAKLNAQKGLLDPQTMEQAYQYYKKTGEYPPEINRIFRVPGAQLEMMNFVSKRQAEDGVTGADRALAKSAFKADTSSLQAITKGMDAVGGFEKGASQSLDLLQRVADKYSRGAFPGINKFSQIFTYHAGDKDIKPFQNALQTAMTEYMKVINAGSNITATELSVMGQQRAKELLSTADNPETLMNSLNLMRQEMKISGDKFKTQRKEIEGRIKTSSSDIISQYDPAIQKAADAYKVDPDLIKSMISAESSGDTNALSPKGARGLMQLMPSTIKTLGVINPNDPNENILKGTQYMASLLKRFGSPTLALAAYNWGPENVAANPDLSKAPQETVDYIKKVSGVDIRAGKTNQSPTNGLQVGTVQKGYKYLGGNPADKNSWTKVQ